jgi:regulatory protein
MNVAGRRREPGNQRSPKSCHERALGLLAVRMRSRRELTDRLRRAGFEGEEVRDVLERLEAVGLVDDERFAEELARHAATVRRSGDRAIASALYAKGVGRDTIERVVANAGEDEESRAQDLASSRVSRLRGLPPEKAFQRLSGLLMRRGYAPTLARSAARRALEIEAAPE